MPFLKERFYQGERKAAFAVLIRKYGITMGRAQKLIDTKRVTCNGEIVTAKNQMLQGDIEVLIFKPQPKGNRPIFKCSDFALFDKPSGVLVHPKKILTHYSMLDEIRTYAGPFANAAHRIDKETSGLLLSSVNRKSEVLLKTMFQEKKIKKSYLAWVRGKTKSSFIVDEPILVRDDYSLCKHKVEINPKGKEAKTVFKRLFYNSDIDASLVEAFPLTGRTHQIRIHLFHVKHPILGDPLYGTNFEVAESYLDKTLTSKERLIYTGASRLMLHAYSLEFTIKNRFYLTSKLDFTKEINNIAPKELQNFSDLGDFWKK